MVSPHSNSLLFSIIGQMYSVKDLAKIIKKRQKEGKSVALVMGCFDILHTGHLKYLQYAKKKADLLVVGLPSDKAVTLTKGKGRPVNTLVDRAFFLSQLKSVDYVLQIDIDVSLSSEEANAVEDSLFDVLRPDFLLVFASEKKSLTKKKKRLKKYGIKILVDRSSKENSTSDLISRIQKIRI